MQRDDRSFEILQCLGRGGFGEVYRARMRTTGGLVSEVAIKVLRADLDPRGDPVRRLRDEGRLLAKLAHPAILAVRDLVVLDARVCLVTELVSGADLSALWTHEPPLPLRPSLQAIAEVAGALAAAHQAHSEGRPLGLVHRDIKPSNLRLGHHGQVKVLDFGIAWSREEDREARTDSDLVVGSLQYMAPERFFGKQAMPAWDVFGLGATLYRGLSSKPLLPRGMHEAASLAFQRGAYERHLSQALRDLDQPEVVRELLAHTLTYDPAERPTAQDLQLRCESLADAAGGPGLAQWCRAFSWPDAAEIDGPLVGRTLSETPSAPVAASDAPEGSARVVSRAVPTVQAAKRPVSRRAPWLIFGVVAAVGAAVVGTLVLVGILLWLSF
jgi:serine/threonine protein kinase